jgi:hypothetical protein
VLHGASLIMLMVHVSPGSDHNICIVLVANIMSSLYASGYVFSEILLER